MGGRKGGLAGAAAGCLLQIGGLGVGEVVKRARGSGR